MSPEYPFDEAATARAAVDDSGVLVGWNAGAERLLGWPGGEVLGRPAARLLAGAGPPRPDGIRWHGTVTLRHRDGREIPRWLVAHHREPQADRPGRWLLFSPLDDGTPPPGTDDPLATAALVQSPCAVAVYDDRLRLRRVNAAMADVIGLPEERVRGLRLAEIGGRPQSEELERRMLQVLTTGRPADVQTYLRTGGEERAHAWLARMAPVTDDRGRVRGVCLAAHDITENVLARERLQIVNEASVRIGTTLDVTRTAQELADVFVPALADIVSVDLLDPQEHGEPPSPLTAPVRLRRSAHRSVSPGTPEAVVEPGAQEPYPEGSPQADSLITGRTILAAPATAGMEAWLAGDAARARRVREFGIHSTMSVPIQARGLTLGVAVLRRFRRQDPFTPDDVLLAEEVTARAAVCIDNARRYSRERDTALALQRSLLPRTLPRTAAVDAASRYLPAARAGVGGDWFDVIPLSGMRVALVVGDVVGQGIQASATMGRLRTAVRTLADIDLAPDELLTHLDDLVVRLSAEAGGDGSPGEVGATCLYAVYDPVSRCCALARAGHPPPMVMEPGGTPRQITMPAGPPLGVGGLPFESTELQLPEGSVLAFYTDGLTESRERDTETGRRLLRESMAACAERAPGAGQGADGASLDETCDRVLRALLPVGGVADDVALLLARTRGLPASQVETWHIPPDPALVAPIRKQVVDQLDAWGLQEAAFTAELVVSELVTNAIRYGAHPIRLRLIHDEVTLICEVSDTSHTAPHLRRAKSWDEGGRGLLLVAQLTQRWGSRHTSEGKTIWAEIDLLAQL
ncbi:MULTISPECIES: SpoIIE family protein phosphatase [Streptomyces]|uniref:protein-serine/threonine phosphatase n=1 Tax=Streptomyces doudnae TaxID=3075536 RepID=A0ABD5EGF9_9ACTN|nr:MULTISPECIES: SpoIIE family protein phosphatase [unclassified Streptomyces]MDT0433763.1 SpoIIE family protein phosphatase [Streptomyces sp. DSM 41981]MYQ68941.1 SpoIIE family protein phosphatase [Streptomyces sp. SID4950]SCE50192.1 PAS domain S-box-containing protein [Streptomyces sp. SolWspMP-5a-2]